MGWEAQLKEIIEREGLWKEPPLIPPQNEKAQNYLIYSPVPWSQGNFERMLSVALRLRGHHVDEMICGGGFPACGCEHITVKRPPCGKCIKTAMHWFDLWKTVPLSSDDFRDEKAEAEGLEYLEKIDFQAFADMTYSRMCGLEFRDLPMGLRIYEKVYWYFSAEFSNADAVVSYMRKSAVSYVLTALLSANLFSKKRYDALIICNGKTIEVGPMMDVAQKSGIRTITWEEFYALSDGLPVVERDLANIWSYVKDEILKDEEKIKIQTLLGQRMTSQNTSNFVPQYIYYDDPILDLKEIKRKLNLREESYKVTLFTNFFSDSTSIGMHTIFDSMLDWIDYCIEYAADSSDIDLIIRIHPAERDRNLIYNKGNTVQRHLSERYGALPENVKVIKGEDEISSYTLMQMSDFPMCYSSTLVLEAPLLGKKCAVTGKVAFVDENLMLGLKSKNHLKQVLDARTCLPAVTKELYDIALKNAYLYFKRFYTQLDFYNPQTQEYSIHSLDMFKPGGHVFWENVCDSIVNRHAFIDLNSANRIPVSSL